MIMFRNFVAIAVCALLVNCTGGCQQNSAQKDSYVGKLALSWLVLADRKSRMMSRSTGMPIFRPENVFGQAVDQPLTKLITDTIDSAEEKGAKPPKDLPEKAVKIVKDKVPDFYADAVEAVGELMEACDSLETDKQKTICVEKKLISSPQAIALSKKHNQAHILLYPAH